MLSLQESIGVQSLSIRMAYRLCKHEPELLSELKLILEHANTEFYSTGVKTAIRNILKKIIKQFNGNGNGYRQVVNIDSNRRLEP